MTEKGQPTPEQIEKDKIYAQMGMTDDEFSIVKERLGRLPNYTELGLFSVMWSEHCSYKNSKVLLRKFPTNGPTVLQGPGEGAGIVDIGDGQAVVFKIESHNHPSAVEPFQGAATGVGGIVRDIFSMGARPIALLNSLRFGELSGDETSNRTKYLLEEVVAGIAFYGNCIGIPTVGGEVAFDPCYAGNPLVNAMCVGIIDHKDMKVGQAHGPGNSVMYVGADTGRDGIHGATFASEELTEESDKKRPSVQVGDPFKEKLLLEACLEIIQSDALVGIQDMGAAGLISSSSEMASKAGTGIDMNLDNVPQREENMTAYEMMLSESQERMLLVIKKGREQEITDICEKYDLHSFIVGQVTADKNIKIMHLGKVAADVPTDALVDAPEYHKPSSVPSYYKEFENLDTSIKIDNIKETWLKLLAQPTVASKHWIYDQYDYQVGTNTIVGPGSAAGIVRIRGTKKALAMTTDCNGRYVYLDPYMGGQIAVAEASRNIVASGAKPLAVTDNLNYGSPENPEIFWQMEQSCAGISQACSQLNTPVISGNVSLYNERSGVAIYPTPTIGMVGLVEDTNHITTTGFKNVGDTIYVIGETKSEFGGSELQKLIQGKIFGRPPIINMAVEETNQSFVLSAIRAGLLQSATDISEGGLAAAISECLMSAKVLGINSQGFGLGADIKLAGDATSILFSESQSRFIVSVSEKDAAQFEKLSKDSGVNITKLGTTNETGNLTVQLDNETIQLGKKEMKHPWKNSIESLLK